MNATPAAPLERCRLWTALVITSRVALGAIASMFLSSVSIVPDPARPSSDSSTSRAGKSARIA